MEPEKKWFWRIRISFWSEASVHLTPDPRQDAGPKLFKVRRFLPLSFFEAKNAPEMIKMQSTKKNTLDFGTSYLELSWQVDVHFQGMQFYNLAVLESRHL